MLEATSRSNQVGHSTKIDNRLHSVKTLVVALFISIVLSACQTHKASPVLYWGSCPDDKGVRMLKKAGFKTVINFRTNSHKGRAKYARELGMNFYHIQSGIVLTPEEKEIRRFLEIVCDPAQQPVYVCCNIGLDRTSYYVAVYRIGCEGWTVEQARDEMLVHGLKQWWWTFKEYDDSLRANEAFIRRTARELNCQHLNMHASKTCPCEKIDLFKAKKKLAEKLIDQED